jgi:hypothetical protein
MMILIRYCIGRFGKTKKNVKRDKINNSIVKTKITSKKEYAVNFLLRKFQLVLGRITRSRGSPHSCTRPPKASFLEVIFVFTNTLRG